MSKDKDDKKRPQLRLVVNNMEQRKPRPAASMEDFIPLDSLVAMRDGFREDFYTGIHRSQEKAYNTLERYMLRKGWGYGLDPHHGKLLVLPLSAVCPEVKEHGAAQQDEVLVYVAEDAAGKGHSLSIEAILPYWSEDETVMEDVLLYSPIFQYGALFLEENRQDGLLDLIYRLGLPIYPPALTGKIMDRFFTTAALEIRETLRYLAEYPGE